MHMKNIKTLPPALFNSYFGIFVDLHPAQTYLHPKFRRSFICSDRDFWLWSQKRGCGQPPIIAGVVNSNSQFVKMCCTTFARVQWASPVGSNSLVFVESGELPLIIAPIYNIQSESVPALCVPRQSVNVFCE